MKQNRFAFIIITAIITCFAEAYALDSCDFKTTYNSDFRPTITVTTPKNNTGKVITDIVFVVNAHQKCGHSHNIFAKDDIRIKESTKWSPNAKKTFTFNPHIGSNEEILSVTIEKVRFFDGTIKEY